MMRGYNWTVLLITCFMMFAWTLNGSIIPPLLPFVIDEFNLSYFQAGLLTTGSMILYTGIQYPVGFLADKFGRKTVMVAGSLLVSATITLISVVADFNQLLICLAIIGIGNGMHVVPSTALIHDYFPIHSRGKALSIRSSAWAMSGFIAPLMAVPLAERMGWRAPFYVCATLSFTAAIIFWVKVKELKSETPPLKKAKKGSIFTPLIIKFAVAAHLSSYDPLFSPFIPVYIIQKFNVTVYTAGLFYMIRPIVMILFSPISGLIVDKFGRKTSIIMSMGLSFLLTVLLIYTHNYFSLISVLALSGFSIGVLGTAIWAYASEIAPPETRAAGIGFINTFWVSGGLSRSPIIGYIADASGFNYSFILVSVIPLISIFILSTLPKHSPTS